jgi:vacuolar protein sorting-associated protein 13A/C
MIYCTDAPVTRLHYILKPIFGTLKLVVNKGSLIELNLPKYVLNFTFHQLIISIEDNQYRDMMWLFKKFYYYSETVKYHKFRPVVTPKEDRKAWWAFAINCVTDDLREKRQKWSWNYIAKCQREGREYMKLYTKKKHPNMTLTEEEKKLLQEMEDQLPYDTIIM